MIPEEGQTWTVKDRTMHPQGRDLVITMIYCSVIYFILLDEDGNKGINESRCTLHHLLDKYELSLKSKLDKILTE